MINTTGRCCTNTALGVVAYNLHSCYDEVRLQVLHTVAYQLHVHVLQGNILWRIRLTHCHRPNAGVSCTALTGSMLCCNRLFCPRQYVHRVHFKQVWWSEQLIIQVFALCVRMKVSLVVMSLISVFLNRRAAARYRALASIISGRERPEETTICCKVSLVQWLITNLHVHIRKCTNTLYDYVIINY